MSYNQLECEIQLEKPKLHGIMSPETEHSNNESLNVYEGNEQACCVENEQENISIDMETEDHEVNKVTEILFEPKTSIVEGTISVKLC